MKRYTIPIMLSIFMQLVCRLCALDLPVFFLKYDGGIGSEETELEEIETSSYRHTASLRIKEKLSEQVTTNLNTTVSRKEYLFRKGSYFYVNVNPDISWSFSDNLQWTNDVKSQWTFYDELDSYGISKDLISIRTKTSLSVKMDQMLKLTPSFQGSFSLHENPEKSSQTYTVGIGINSSLGNLSLTGKYSGILRLSMGTLSTISDRFNSEFGINLTWDPNAW